LEGFFKFYKPDGSFNPENHFINVSNALPAATLKHPFGTAHEVSLKSFDM
jgi:hypothetical protein